MSVRVMADVWDFGPDDPVDNSVLLRLANHCNDDGKNCFPSIEDVSRAIRRSERTVTRSIANLETDGWLKVEQRGSGKGHTSQYIINVAMLKGRQAVRDSKGDTVTLKGDSLTGKGDTLSVKGDSLSKPPHPLKGVTINEPSLNHQEPDSLDPEIPGSQPVATPAPEPERKLVGTIPTNTGDPFPLYRDQAEEWQRTYPAIDVMQELREMKAWANANPKDRKTAKGMLRFVNSWLAREQDKGGRNLGGDNGKPQSNRYTIADDNRRAAQEVLHELRARRGDDVSTYSLGDGIRAATAQGDLALTSGNAGGDDRGRSGNGTHPGADGGRPILPHPGPAAGTGGRRNPTLPF